MNAQSDRQKAAVCSYYDPDPKCTEDERNTWRKRFGLPTLDKIHRRNGRGGTKNELVVGTVAVKQAGGLALVVQRDRSGAPWIEVHRLLWNGKPWDRTPLRAKIPETTWDLIIAKAKAVELVYATGEILVCGATFTIEFVDREGIVRAPVGDNCGHEPRGVFFAVLADAAIAQFPHCAALIPANDYEWNVGKLKECFVLQGDKMAAAELYNLLHLPDNRPFWETNGWSDQSEFKPFLDDDIWFSWPGIPPIEDAETAAEFWAGDWLERFEFKYDSIHAQSADWVRIDGHVTIARLMFGGCFDEPVGTFSSIWRRGADGKFRMSSFEHLATKPAKQIR